MALENMPTLGVGMAHGVTYHFSRDNAFDATRPATQVVWRREAPFLSRPSVSVTHRGN